jgi:UDP-3-O-[3-hydroxymyristoyl] N-acetylglucosamine deacetylase
MKQKTIKEKCIFKGIGIHSGKTVTMVVLPAQENAGIVFKRVDCVGEILVSIENVSPANRATILQKDGVRVCTPEHFLAACYALGISNLIVEIDAEEVPIMDGSSLDFLNGFLKVGIVEQLAEIKAIILAEPIIVKDGEKQILALPDDEFKITYILEYDNFIGTQINSFKITATTFEKQLASARTYGFYSEVKALMERGLAQGGSFDNAVVIGENDYMNELRFSDELVRHKILDCIGDFAILGVPVKAHFIAMKSGHSLNHKLVRELSYL